MRGPVDREPKGGAARRLHDLGRSGWESLLLLVPIYNLYLGLVLLCQRGQPGSNAHGPDPLA